MSELLGHSSMLLLVSPIFVLALRHSPGLALVCALATSGLLFIPINEVSLILQLKGVFADLSLTTVMLLITWPILKITNRSLNEPDISVLCTVVLILSLALYPMALGVGFYDPYGLGFQPGILISLVAAMGFLAVHKNYWICVVAVLVVLFGFWLKALPSHNLWDYMLDPILVIFTVIYLLQRLFRLRISRYSKGTLRST